MIVNLGWSDGGRGELRAGHSDREEVRALLKVARDEGRIDETEYDRRVDAVQPAKTRGDLVRLTTDLPERAGVREWVDGMRVRGADREDARRWLVEAAAQGRLTDQEYERRLAALSTVTTYAELRAPIEGLPGWSGTPREYQLAGAADREAALAALAEAVSDGRVGPVEAPTLEADIQQARRVGTLDTLVAGLPDRVSDQERQETVDALTEAHRDGQLDIVEYTARAGQAREAARDAELVPLVADLRGDARRLAESDRQAVADTLKRALDEGKLELAEFDERVRAAHAATTMAEVAPLVADLTSPPRSERRTWTDDWFDIVVNSALVTAPRRTILKVVWMTSTTATLLAYAYLITWNWVVTLAALWLPLLALLAIEAVVVVKLAGPVSARQQAIIDGLGADLDRLRAKQPAIEQIKLEYPALEVVRDEDGEVKVETRSRVAKIEISFAGYESGRALRPSLRDEITRLLWLTRLYPLDTIWFGEPHMTDNNLGTVRLDGPEEEKLRHRYGPRPYGPYQED